MLSIYAARPEGLTKIGGGPEDPIPEDAVWLDLIEPTPAEEKHVEETLRVDVPTREEMREIEASNRLFEENGDIYLTATIVTKLDTDLPESSQVTFILAGNRMVTNRYVDPLPFRRFISYAQKHPLICSSPGIMLAGLLEAIINRIADVIERVGADLDSTSVEVFTPPSRGRKRSAARDFREILGRIGQSGETISKTRESLVSLGRLLVFVQQTTAQQWSTEVKARFRTLSRDVTALSDHASFLGTKLSFMLDATLGMVSIDQNNILKIFSVVTVFLLPPSVIAGFYGMNFEHIPWLHTTWGWQAALAMMLASAVVPYFWFKKRGWL